MPILVSIPGEDLGLIESQEIHENNGTNSSSNEWSSPTVERNLLTMDRARKSTECDRSPEASDDEENRSAFALGLAKSSSVVARASMWQQLQQQAKGNLLFSFAFYSQSSLTIEPSHIILNTKDHARSSPN